MLGEAADHVARAEKRINRLTTLAGLAGELFLAIALIFKNALEDDEERRHFDRFRQKLFGAFFDRLHRQVNRGVPGEDDDGHARINLP